MIDQPIQAIIDADRERLASWIVANGFATGYGGSMAELLAEVEWQVKELRVQRQEKTCPPGFWPS